MNTYQRCPLLCFGFSIEGHIRAHYSRKAAAVGHASMLIAAELR